MSTKKKLLEAAAGVASGGPVYVEDVFSTYLYEGTNSTQGIPNGINLGDFGVGTSTRFNGTGDHLSRSSDLTGNADGKTLTFSCWVFLPPMDDRAGNTNQRVLYATDSSDNGVLFNVDSSGYLGLEAWNGGVRTLQGTTTTKIGTNVWTNILVSMDMANSSNRYVYFNDNAASVTWSTYNNANIEFTRSTHYIGVWGNGTARYFYDDMAHFYLDYTYRDLSTESNRRIFIDANGGSTSASSLAALNPIMYLPMTTAYAVGKNAGTGGDFTASGSPTIVENGTEYVADSGQGGLVWLKNRSLTVSHRLIDTERGVSNRLESDTYSAEYFQSGQFVTGFNSSGFTVDGTETGANDGYTPSEYTSWTFRKQEKFFDIVTYTGNGANRTIAHNLGSVPGMIIVKMRTLTGYSWQVYHRSLANTERIELDTTGGKSTGATTYWNSTTATDAVFSLGTSVQVNKNGDEYVAYLFAHNDGDGEFGEDGDQDIIKCGSFTTTSTWGNFKEDIGFEPQWLMVKRTDSTSDWVMLDTMRGVTGEGDQALVDTGMFGSGSDDQELKANSSSLESTQGRGGFYSRGYLGNFGGFGNATYIYMAIRRPHKPAEEFAATDLFAVDNRTTTTSPAFISGFPVDMAIQRTVDETGSRQIASRLTGSRVLFTDSTSTESTISSVTFDYMNGHREGASANADEYAWMFRRAPGFFDVVAYTGDGQAGREIPHNLGVVPEMMWLKTRSETGKPWQVYHKDQAPNITGKLNENSSFALSDFSFSNTRPTDSVFTVGASSWVNVVGSTNIAYLFATVAGISKVGSYTGTAADLNVDCGFSAGARFVLVKRTDSTGDWYLWDSERGIVAGNDPYLLLNDTAAQVTNTDYIDPLSSGFTITSSAPAALNASGGTYIFLAIA